MKSLMVTRALWDLLTAHEKIGEAEAAARHCGYDGIKVVEEFPVAVDAPARWTGSVMSLSERLRMLGVEDFIPTFSNFKRKSKGDKKRQRSEWKRSMKGHK